MLSDDGKNVGIEKKKLVIKFLGTLIFKGQETAWEQPGEQEKSGESTGIET